MVQYKCSYTFECRPHSVKEQTRQTPRHRLNASLKVDGDLLNIVSEQNRCPETQDQPNFHQTPLNIRARFRYSVSGAAVCVTEERQQCVYDYIVRTFTVYNNRVTSYSSGPIDRSIYRRARPKRDGSYNILAVTRPTHPYDKKKQKKTVQYPCAI